MVRVLAAAPKTKKMPAIAHRVGCDRSFLSLAFGCSGKTEEVTAGTPPSWCLYDQYTNEAIPCQS